MSTDKTYDHPSELPESQLKKSPTWVKYADEFGTCSGCGEHSGVLEYCCGDRVHFEGGTMDSEELWNEIEAELSEQAEAQIYDHDE